MDAFIVKKRRRSFGEEEKELSTDDKLGVLSSLFPKLDSTLLLEILLAVDGSLEEAQSLLKDQDKLSASPSKKRSKPSVHRQSSLATYSIGSSESSSKRPLTKKGKTLHLYDPKDIEDHTPCSIIHNFLPQAEANALLKELLTEAPSFDRQTFKLFDRVVTSPHTAAFFVPSNGDVHKQQNEYYYNGRQFEDVRLATPELLRVSDTVRETVNREIKRRLLEKHDGVKLQYQSPDEWVPNCSFVNCYDGAKESVGYHSDQLTYLGPRAIIGSISLGVAREFRVRRILAKDDEAPSKISTTSDLQDRADAEGQISIHLPHNSLLIMHAEMQEEWKHSIAPAQVIEPHPIAGNKRINITYRCYKDHFHPKFTPRCRCGIPCVMRCVQRKSENKGRYMWSCHAHYTPGEDG
jgi:alkylated DNA repair dioxygenase AlkB